MADVWLAEDERLGRWVAVKLLRESATGDEVAASIEREARLVARLQHPNIVAIYDVGHRDGQRYLVMEYVHGHAVRQVLEARGRLTEQEAVRYGGQIAGALQYAHEQGVVHCDIKPENILVNEQGVAKAVDFGVAETITRTMTPDQARDILGTIAYLAPEVIQGSPPDARSDVYSLGLTIYEMVAGRLPFSGTTPAAIAGQRLANAAPPLRAFAREASAELESVLARALALSPYDRYQTAGELAAALRRVPQQARPAAVPPVIATAPVPPIRQRHQTARVTRGRRAAPPPPRATGPGGAAIAAVIAALALALGVGIAAAVVLSRGEDDNGGGPAPTPSPSATRTAATQEPTATPTRPSEPTPTATPTTAPTETPTPTRTPPPTQTQATPTATRTQQGNNNPTPSPSPPTGTAAATPTGRP
ncbi:MAG: serine/threonine protein kinase [Dehalococcoidia bacterium]|nr:serine/threonine protein kinase [Dehalococcoidia bacterium]